MPQLSSWLRLRAGAHRMRVGTHRLQVQCLSREGGLSVKSMNAYRQYVYVYRPSPFLSNSHPLPSFPCLLLLPDSCVTSSTPNHLSYIHYLVYLSYRYQLKPDMFSVSRLRTLIEDAKAEDGAPMPPAGGHLGSCLSSRTEAQEAPFGANMTQLVRPPGIPWGYPKPPRVCAPPSVGVLAKIACTMCGKGCSCAEHTWSARQLHQCHGRSTFTVQ